MRRSASALRYLQRQIVVHGVVRNRIGNYYSRLISSSGSSTNSCFFHHHNWYHRRFVSSSTHTPPPRMTFVSSGTDRAQEALKQLRDRYEDVGLEHADTVVALGGDGFMLQVRRKK